MSGIRVALSGAAGRMGRVLAPGLEGTPGIELVAKIEKDDDLVAIARAARAEVVVDFTTPATAVQNVRRILEAGCHGVIGTTGFLEADLLDLDARARAARLGVLVAPNFAMGSILLQRFAAEAARIFTRCEIVEYHHDGKVDAPSGTALRTAEAIAAARAAADEGSAGAGGSGPGGALTRPVGASAGSGSRGAEHAGVRVHAVRLPGFVAHQEVIFGGLGEVLTLRHDAISRECYLPGVVLGVREIRGRLGLLRGLESLLSR